MSKTIRVAMIIQRYYPFVGGAEQQLRSLAPLLQSCDVDVQVYTRQYPGLKSYEIVDGVPVSRITAPRPKPLASFAFTCLAAEQLRRWRPDVVHAHALFSPATTALAAKSLLGIPLIATAHRSGYLGDVSRLKRKLLGEWRLSQMGKHIDAFIVISREIDRELAEAGIPPERRPFIPNGIDLERFRPVSKEQKALKKKALGYDGPTVIYAGRLVPEKRVDRLIELWSSVRRRHLNARLLILGTGPEEKKLQQLADSSVAFLGLVEDVVPYLQASDIFVLPSAYEGFSVAILEALATGLPVVATAVGGAPDLIDHGENGWLVPADDFIAFGEALDTLLSNPALRESLGIRGRERVASEYGIQHTAQRLASLYRNMASSTRRSNESLIENHQL